MDVRFICAGDVEECQAADVPALLARPDGFVWIDVPEWSPEAEALLSGHDIGAHPIAIDTCKKRNHVPTIHGYQDYVFLVLHTPGIGRRGHVHMLELDQLIGTRFLVTVHGPLNPEVSIEQATEECDEVLRRIAFQRFSPSTPAELSFAIVSAMARRQRSAIGEIAEQIPELEQRVMEGDFRQPEAMLEEMFLLRHELITIRTMASQCREIYARLSSLVTVISNDDIARSRDLAGQFKRVSSIADGECDFLFGVIDLYQTKVNTKMTIAMERLAVIAAVTLPITAIASVYGMNVIVNYHTQPVQLVVVLVIMLVISGLLLHWTRRQGWW